MRLTLTAIFLLIFAGMLLVTTLASFERGVFEAASDLWPDPWFKATLADAYFGYITVFAWVAYRERTLLARAIWLVLFLALGNIAISCYILIQLYRLPPGATMETLLLRPEASRA